MRAVPARGAAQGTAAAAEPEPEAGTANTVPTAPAGTCLPSAGGGTNFSCGRATPRGATTTRQSAMGHRKQGGREGEGDSRHKTGTGR